MSMLAEVRKIVDRWYVSEGALFHTFVSHNFEENLSISVPFRSGRGKVEYNSMILSALRPREVELYLKAEMVRILLKHPYERQPSGCNKKSIAIGSNLVLGDNYDFSEINMPTPEAFDLRASESFEWYAHRVDEMLYNREIDLDSLTENPNDDKSSSDSANGDQGDADGREASDKDEPREGREDSPAKDVDTISSTGQSRSSDDEGKGQTADKPQEDRDLESEMKDMGLADLWEEDPMMGCTIDALLNEIQASNDWGSLAGTFAKKVIANTPARLNYRKELNSFRASVLSTKRHLTRMRPSRRTGFDNMGMMRRLGVHLLIAVDVSASIGEANIRHFYSVINRFFHYGVDSVDVVQFDTSLAEVQKMTKKALEVKVLGFGGTSYQPLFDYLSSHPEYGGVIIFTDGDAPIPTVSPRMKTRVLWVCCNSRQWEVNKNWMERIGRSCAIEV